MARLWNIVESSARQEFINVSCTFLDVQGSITYSGLIQHIYRETDILFIFVYRLFYF